MADKAASIIDLPLDILVLIFPCLDAKSFLALCSTCKAFQQPSIRLDPAYWSYVTRSVFRVPNQPVVQHDGNRWQKLYRRLLTQSRAYTWGNNTHSRLGHSYADNAYDMPMMPRMRPGRRHLHDSTHCSFPTEMEDTRSLGVVADMQCGGWSTTLLTSRGTLHTVGVLDGQMTFATNGRLRPLNFPAGYPSSSSPNDTKYEEPTVAIRQFSAGRSHILALSDSGRIWSWYHIKSPALQIKFTNVELKETTHATATSNASAYGNVKQVVAGWSFSSAYVHGVGIVIWLPVQRDHDDDETLDTMLVLDSVEVPRTAFQRAKDTRSVSQNQKTLGEEVGAVINYVMLEHFVVFVTDIGKVFCAKFADKLRINDVLELPALGQQQRKPLDVQGSFRRFAIFRNNEVITSDQDYLETAWAGRDNPELLHSVSGLHKIPALQHSDVISVAFGDYHYLALHSNGSITSYGQELGACGALGLGGDADGHGHARGIIYDRFSHDGRLVPHASLHGRRVWFDARKKEWLQSLIQGGKDPVESNERREMVQSDSNVQGEVSEWIEQESRVWDDMQKGEDGLNAYFALRISAAGWHSGALVLVNEELAHMEQAYSFDGHSFPRLRLTDNREMPGSKAFDDWREGQPTWPHSFDNTT